MLTRKHTKTSSMAISIAAAALVVVGGLTPQKPSGGSANQPPTEYVAGEILVVFRPGVGAKPVDTICKGMRATRIKAFPKIAAQHWRLPRGRSLRNIGGSRAG